MKKTYSRKNLEVIRFVRHHPIWYRYLMRDPGRIHELEEKAREYNGKTLADRLEKLHQQIDMVKMFIHLAHAMKD